MTERLPGEGEAKVLVVIPARGGSKGIPRKNLRALHGQPLLSYGIGTALASRYRPDVYVSSEDPEILSVARKYGARVLPRDPSLAGGDVTLDPVVHRAFIEISRLEQKQYDLIVTLQPTSPLVATTSLDQAIASLVADSTIDTVLSARDDTHLTWRLEGGRYLPNYSERLNRQYLKPVFRETGGFLITRAPVITARTRIGQNVALHILADGEAIDIDTHEDFNLCDYYLRRRTILFVVTGHREAGLGHVHRALILANRLVNHHLLFLVDHQSELAYKKIAESAYEVHQAANHDLVREIRKLRPDVVINDILDTDSDYVHALRSLDLKVINLEDLGEGAQHADLVINDLYPETRPLPNHYFGPEYFCARDEILLSDHKRVSQTVTRVLITFGGTDSQDLTRKVLNSIYDFCRHASIQVTVVLGLGYAHDALPAQEGVAVCRDVRNISDLILDADIVFTSAGRTVYEITCIGTPAIVLAQNARETSHLGASAGDGFVNLGLGLDASPAEIAEAFRDLVEDYARRQQMHEAMMSKDLKRGIDRVIRLIEATTHQSSARK